MLMLMPLLGMVPMAMVAMVLVIEDIVDTMDIHTDTDIADTGERRRGLLMPPLMPMLMLTLTTLDTMVLVLDTVHIDTLGPQLAGVDTELDTTGDRIFIFDSPLTVTSLYRALSSTSCGSELCILGCWDNYFCVHLVEIKK